MAKKSTLRHRLYHGETSFDFIGKRNIWFIASAVVIGIGIFSLVTQGLNLGIDFKGGVAWTVKTRNPSVSSMRDAVRPFGLGEAQIQTTGNDTIKIESKHLSQAKQDEVTAAVAKEAKVPAEQVSVTEVGPSWGKAVTNKARTALIVFFILIAAYISFRFEWKMAVSAIVAVIHDILVTVGIYSLSRFEVTPATVVAFLTILGYSLYDTIVVFDRVKENERRIAAAGLGAADLVNISTNQVLMRSLNTSLSALLPVMSLLVVGAWLLGQVTLLEFALALLIGMLTGAYSSIFIATPVFGILKGGRRSSDHLVGEGLRTVVVRGVGILSPVAPRRRAASRAAPVPVGATAGAITPGVEPTAEQLLGRAPRPRKKKRH